MKIYKNIRIVYEDNHIIVVEKPAGILSQKINERAVVAGYH
jgi:23S rRNA-/tRNA-specific pseudouridylate synthase